MERRRVVRVVVDKYCREVDRWLAGGWVVDGWRLPVDVIGGSGRWQVAGGRWQVAGGSAGTQADSLASAHR